MSTRLAETTSPGANRRRLYVFSPLPPQHNGLADYIVEYLPMLVADFEVCLVVEAGTLPGRTGHLRNADIEIIDESVFLARQPEPQAQVLYNLGNNGDCVYQLEYVHSHRGAVILHDVSLFYLHQVALQREKANGLFHAWLSESGHEVPADFVARDGSLATTPGLLYQECLMVQRLAESATGVMIHSRYAEARFLGGAFVAAGGSAAGPPVARIPHFVLPPVASSAVDDLVVRRFGIHATDIVLLVPGFLTGNKMLYEVLVAYAHASRVYPRLRLVFAGEEREAEYALSERIRRIWPRGDGPLVTGYLDGRELDALLGRADLSFVLRYPTYGETSGILPRAVMGGGRVVTVDIGSYPEFDSPSVTVVPVGAGLTSSLLRCIENVCESPDSPGDRLARRAAEAARARSLSPHALYPRIKTWLDQAWELAP